MDTLNRVETSYEYHRLARSDPGYRWWKALVTAALAFAFFLSMSIMVAFALVAVGLIVPPLGKELLELVKTGAIDNSNPVILAFSLISVAIMLPAIWTARAIMGPHPTGLISSVAGRIRWRWMSRLAIPVIVAFGVSVLLSSVVVPLLAGEPLASPKVASGTWLLVILTVLLVPFQATAEEYVFRGYLMQAFGGWLRHPLFAILLSIPFFTLGHQYDVWGLLDVSVFAFVAGYLAWRTGGLEASILAHIVNNTVIFVIGAFGLVDVNSKSGSWVDVLITAATLGLYCLFVGFAAKRFGLHRTREVITADPVSAEPVVAQG